MVNIRTSGYQQCYQVRFGDTMVNGREDRMPLWRLHPQSKWKCACLQRLKGTASLMVTNSPLPFPYWEPSLVLKLSKFLVFRKQKGTGGTSGDNVGNLSDLKATTQVLHWSEFLQRFNLEHSRNRERENLVSSSTLWFIFRTYFLLWQKIAPSNRRTSGIATLCQCFQFMTLTELKTV